MIKYCTMTEAEFVERDRALEMPPSSACQAFNARFNERYTAAEFVKKFGYDVPEFYRNLPRRFKPKKHGEG